MSVHEQPTQVEPPADDADRWEPVRELPPSAKLVAKVLDDHERLTQSELADETLLSTRTVCGAVSRLEERGVVESRVLFTDARKQLYRLTI